MKNIFTLLITLVLIGCASKKQTITLSKKNETATIKTNAIKKVSNSKILYLVDGKEVSGKAIEKMDTNAIKTITVIKGKENVIKYTKKEYDGVIIIEMKKNN